MNRNSVHEWMRCDHTSGAIACFIGLSRSASATRRQSIRQLPSGAKSRSSPEFFTLRACRGYPYGSFVRPGLVAELSAVRNPSLLVDSEGLLLFDAFEPPAACLRRMVYISLRTPYDA